MKNIDKKTNEVNKEIPEVINSNTPGLVFQPPFKVDLKNSTDLFRYIIWVTFMHPHEESWENIKFETDPLTQLKLASKTGDFHQTKVIGKSSNLIFHSENQLNNLLDEEQTMKSESFSYSITDSTTVSFTAGFSLSQELDFKIGKTTFNYSFSGTKSSTHSETKTIVAPIQQVKVAPKKSVVVNYNVFSDIVKEEGIVKTEVDLESVISYQGMVYASTTGNWVNDKIRMSDLYKAFKGYPLDFLSTDDYALKFKDGKIYVNLPISCVTSAGRLDVTFEEPKKI